MDQAEVKRRCRALIVIGLRPIESVLLIGDGGVGKHLIRVLIRGLLVGAGKITFGGERSRRSNRDGC